MLIRSSTGCSASFDSPNSSFLYWNLVAIPTSARRSALRFPSFSVKRIHGSPLYSTSSQICGMMLMIPVVRLYSSRVFTRNTVFFTPSTVAVW